MYSYYLTSRSKIIYAVTSLVALVALISLFLYIARNIFCIQIYFLGVGLFSIYALFQKLKNEHIALTEKGVEYHAPGVILETDWESVEQISNHWRYGFVHECLLVDNSRIRMRKWSFFLGGRNVPTPLFSSCTFPNYSDNILALSEGDAFVASRRRDVKVLENLCFVSVSLRSARQPIVSLIC